MPKVTALPSIWLDHYPQHKKTLPGGSSLAFAAAISRYSHIEPAIIGLMCDEGRYTDDIFNTIDLHRIKKLVYVDAQHQGETGSNTVYLRENGEHYNIPGDFYSGCIGFRDLQSKDYDALNESDLIHIPFGTPLCSDITYRYRFDNLSIDFARMHDFRILDMNLDAKYIFIDGTTDEEDVLTFATHKRTSLSYIVVQLGRRGSIVYYRNKKYIREADYVPNMVDTNGCNECYQAGFLAKILETGDIEAAMAEGAKLYAECSQILGMVLPPLKRS